MAVELESQLEEQFIEQLVGMKYERISVKNEEEVYENFHVMLNRFNQENLDSPITVTEFNRLLRKIGKKSVYESAEILRSKQLLERENGEVVYIQLFNPKNWTANYFQVANQVQDEGTHKGRYDVTIFVNGLPLVQIELKRRGIDYKEAFNQIARYKLHNFGGLFGFVQIFVVSNGVTTKYFANKDGQLEFSQTFYWTDEENNRIANLPAFTSNFLNPSHLNKMLFRYMILNKASKRLMVMRPYQIYATEALIKQAVETDSNGFVWHTTGSGKTMTSFKASQLLSMEPGIDLVFFLVDRVDLDSQTLKEFNKFHHDSVDTTDKTDTLVRQISDVKVPLIITTIQKMNTAITTARHREIMEQHKDKRVVFIVDECHRTQFGSMHNRVKNFFTNAQYFGFTGTPIMPENRSADGRTTADIFGRLLHSYLIKNAIHDKNVLGFSISYWDTMKHRDTGREERVKSINKQEAYESPERIELIVSHVLENHHQLTRNKEYTAMLAAPSIPALTMYYDFFKAKEHDLTIAAVFTYGSNEDMEMRDEHSKDTMARMLVDYNERFGTNYSLETYPAYQANVAERVVSTQIDILLVVNKFLTGFDSKMLNTLYVDKNMESHNLIQAYSRTNRIAGSTKPFGNIIVYRPLRTKTNDAIRMYSDVENADEVLMKIYDEYIEDLSTAVNHMKEIAPEPVSVESMMDETEQKDFIKRFREVMRLMRVLENFTEFEPAQPLPDFTDSELADYKSQYLDIYDGRSTGEGVSILQDIDFEIELFKTDKVNVHYILNLLRAVDLDDADAVKKQTDEIEKSLGETSNESLRLKADLIRKFIREVLPTIDSSEEVGVEFEKFEEHERVHEIADFAESHRLTAEQLRKFIADFQFTGTMPRGAIKSSFKGSFLEKKRIAGNIGTFIETHLKKFQR